MTGLSLRQSELEVCQQNRLKLMLRRIRAARRKGPARTPRTPRSGRHSFTIAKHANVSDLLLPESQVVGKQDAGEWRDTESAGNGSTVVSGDVSGNEDDDDDDEDDDRAMLRRMDVTMEIGDGPDDRELRARVAQLFNNVFEAKPQISGDRVTVDRLSGAMTNCVFMVAVEGAYVGRRGTELPRKYLLRVYGAGVDEFLSRENELYWLGQLSALGFGPRLYGIFGNGRLEEFLESTTLQKEDLRHPSTSKHIARRMSELHALVSYYRPFEEGRCSRPHHHHQAPAAAAAAAAAIAANGSPGLWSNIDAWMQLVQKKWARIAAVCGANERCVEILAGWADLERAAGRLRALVEASKSPVVFAHDDLQYGNILRLRDTGELVVVDFEYAGYNYRGFDIANHFCEWMADYHGSRPHLLDETQYPTDGERKCFLRTYVKAKAFLDANMKAEAGLVESDAVHAIKLRAVNLSEDRLCADVAALEREIAPFVPASHLHWGVWGLLQACSSEIDFDYVGYATHRLSIFLRQVEEMI
ncbi:hypothetical protein LPJ61_002411 [Coemansia biformis]|uniref:Kinase-like protein n=1 Tax=Coemansia biformis TaxID=1286918 RepID=A0A9W8CWG5_9FUNG|nr:hypothetical protein LPJ61_002411 [Coemansia biformis]